MDNQYATFNIQKIQTTAELAARYKHNRRIVVNSNVDASRVSQSILGKNNCHSLISGRIKQIQSIRVKAGARKMRANTVVAVELVLGASSSFFEFMSRNDIKDWAQDNVEWAKRYYKGKGQLVTYDLHLDESTPHIHLIFAPETKKVDKHTSWLLPVFDAKGFHGNKSEMNRARTSHAEALKHWGLIRGENYYETGEQPPQYTKSVKELRRQMAKYDEININNIYNLWKSLPKDELFNTRQDENNFQTILESYARAGDKDSMVNVINEILPTPPTHRKPGR